jgi:hypothetical protein
MSLRPDHGLAVTMLRPWQARCVRSTTVLRHTRFNHAVVTLGLVLVASIPRSEIAFRILVNRFGNSSVFALTAICQIFRPQDDRDERSSVVTGHLR